ncbi:MAG: class I SAM-dependent methyltransferase [Actinomycetota bacterium]
MSYKRWARKIDDILWGGALRHWYQRNFILGGNWGAFLDRLGKVPAGSMVLDLGAGEAGLRVRFPKATYIAIDRGLAHSWDYSKLDVVSDAAEIPFREKTFDFIICKQVLEHVPDPIKLLKEAQRVLKPGGVIVLSTNQAWPQHQQPYDFFRFTSYGLRHCFESADLDIESMEAMGGAFTAAIFHFSQIFAPHLWARTKSGWELSERLTKPVAWMMRLLAPLANALDRRDKTKDNTLGWYVLARRRPS